MKKRQYNLVKNEDFDFRVPLHTEAAFQHGILFHARLIGSMEIPRPTTRIEIVAAMRRIRYEHKARGVDKRNVSILVSKQGVKVLARKRRLRKSSALDDDKLVIQHYPIYRVFYVSHDSQDLQIFSYIARESHANVFTCSVFKADKKNVAVRVVRTIGQAFDVCNGSTTPDSKRNSRSSDGDSSVCADAGVDSSKTTCAVVESCSDPLSLDLPPYDEPRQQHRTVTGRLHGVDGLATTALDASASYWTSLLHQEMSANCGRGDTAGLTSSTSTAAAVHTTTTTTASVLGVTATGQQSCPTWTHTSLENHELLLLRETLVQQRLHTQEALAQVRYLRDQLNTEQTARLDAQTRCRQLLAHNGALVAHLRRLVQQLRHNAGGSNNTNESFHHHISSDSAVGTALSLK